MSPIEWICGSISGAALSVVGHPLDTLKTRMQSSSTLYRSVFHCFRDTIKHDGWSALYRGFGPAAVTTISTSTLRFGLQGRVNEFFAHLFSSRSDSNQGRYDGLSFGLRFASEAFGGFACGAVLPIIFTPLELVKCKKQVLRTKLSNFAIAKEVWRGEGLRGLYTGHMLTTYRSTIWNAALFGSYFFYKELLGDFLAAQQRIVEPVPALVGPPPPPPGRLLHMAAGVLSGFTVILFVFPIDAAKSRQQVRQGTGGGGGGVVGGAQNLATNKGSHPRGLLGGLAELAREGALYRGASAQSIRAVPIHAIYLPLYDALVEFGNGAMLVR